VVSRLNSGGVYRLENLSEIDQCQLLQDYAAELGLILPSAVGHYFIHQNKDLKTMIDWLEQLDGLAIGKKRKLSLHFVKDILTI